MRKLLNEIGAHLTAFLKQRDDVALILNSPAGDSVPMLKILEGLEEASSSDLHWRHTDAFTDARAYVSGIVAGFATKHELVRLSMVKEQMTPWPPIPPQILSDDAPPAQRLRALGAFSRELLPIPNGGNNVWIFYPLEVADYGAFARLMEELIRHDFPFPWCHHLRFIVRADPGQLEVRAALGASPRIRWYQPDLSMNAINQSLEADIADESLPLYERIAPVPIMAGNDFAWGRYPEAIQKYELLLRYYAPINNYPMAAVALNGMGESYEKMGDLERANESYEAALIPASHGDHPPVAIFLNVVTNLGNLRAHQAQWADAEAYYDMAQQLATAARNASAKISALENRGLCQQQQGKIEEALGSWNDGAVIAAQLEDAESCRALLSHIEKHYTAAGEDSKAVELREQLAALSAR